MEGAKQYGGDPYDRMRVGGPFPDHSLQGSSEQELLGYPGRNGDNDKVGQDYPNAIAG